MIAFQGVILRCNHGIPFGEPCRECQSPRTTNKPYPNRTALTKDALAGLLDRQEKEIVRLKKQILVLKMVAAVNLSVIEELSCQLDPRDLGKRSG